MLIEFLDSTNCPGVQSYISLQNIYGKMLITKTHAIFPKWCDQTLKYVFSSFANKFIEKGVLS